MPFLLPASIKKAKKELEEVNKQSEGLGKIREALMSASRANDAELSQFKELIATHEAVLKTAKKIKEAYQSFINPTRKSMKEALEKAGDKSVGEYNICKNEEWYTERQDALEELDYEYTWALGLVTDLNHYIGNLTSTANEVKKAEAAQAQEEVKPEPKEISTEEPEQNNKEENEGDEEVEPAQLVSLEPQTLNTLKTSTKGARDKKNSTRNLLRNSMENTMQNGMQNFIPKVQQAQRQNADVNPVSLWNRLAELEGIIVGLEETVEDLKRGKEKYKTKYRKQEVLTAFAERELKRLKEEKYKAAGVSGDQQNLLHKMELNHQDLLHALREGFSGATIEILRANQARM